MWQMHWQASDSVTKAGNVLFNDALNTFYLRLYGIRHMVKDHSDSERGNPLPPHRLLFPIISKVILYAPYHRQDNAYHSLCYTSRGALAGIACGEPAASQHSMHECQWWNVSAWQRQTTCCTCQSGVSAAPPRPDITVTCPFARFKPNRTSTGYNGLTRWIHHSRHFHNFLQHCGMRGRTFSTAA